MTATTTYTDGLTLPGVQPGKPKRVRGCLALISVPCG